MVGRLRPAGKKHLEMKTQTKTGMMMTCHRSEAQLSHQPSCHPLLGQFRRIMVVDQCEMIGHGVFDIYLYRVYRQLCSNAMTWISDAPSKSWFTTLFGAG